jgi:hypothetical protein
MKEPQKYYVFAWQKLYNSFTALSRLKINPSLWISWRQFLALTQSYHNNNTCECGRSDCSFQDFLEANFLVRVWNEPKYFYKLHDAICFQPRNNSIFSYSESQYCWWLKTHKWRWKFIAIYQLFANKTWTKATVFWRSMILLHRVWL